MRISSPQLINDSKQTKISTIVEYSQGKVELWYIVDKIYGEFLTVENLDSFLLGVLILAMKYKEDIYLDGVVSERLFYNITNYFMKILSLLIPSLSPVKIMPKGLNNNKISPIVQGVGTGFSGGIDSFCTLIDHLQKNTPPSYKITHLVFNNVGSHGEGGRELFNKRFDRLLKFSQEYQLPLIKIDSNLHEILEKINFQNTHTTRNLSAILLLQKLFSKYFYASAHKYEDCIIKKSPDGAVIDPAAIHLLSTETIECISTGCQYSRVEKTIKVADFEPSYRYLDVCVHAVECAENCSQCWKCARTLLTLEILKKQHLYTKVFNLEKFAQVRQQSIQNLCQSSSPLDQEVLRLAEQKKICFN